MQIAFNICHKSVNAVLHSFTESKVIFHKNWKNVTFYKNGYYKTDNQLMIGYYIVFLCQCQNGRQEFIEKLLSEDQIQSKTFPNAISRSENRMLTYLQLWCLLIWKVLLYFKNPQRDLGINHLTKVILTNEKYHQLSINKYIRRLVPKAFKSCELFQDIYLFNIVFPFP